MATRSFKDVQADAVTLLAEADRIKKLEKLGEIQDSINARVAESEKALHEARIAPYKAYHDALDYIRKLEQDITDNGQDALDGFSGVYFKAKMSADYSSCLTTATTPIGASIEIAGSHYIVSGFQKGYGGNTATLVHCNSSYETVGEKQTPWSRVPCRFLAHKKEVILARSFKLKGNIIIDGKQWRPVAVGTTGGLTSYAVEEV